MAARTWPTAGGRAAGGGQRPASGRGPVGDPQLCAVWRPGPSKPGGGALGATRGDRRGAPPGPSAQGHPPRHSPTGHCPPQRTPLEPLPPTGTRMIGASSPRHPPPPPRRQKGPPLPNKKGPKGAALPRAPGLPPSANPRSPPPPSPPHGIARVALPRSPLWQGRAYDVAPGRPEGCAPGGSCRGPPSSTHPLPSAHLRPISKAAAEGRA